MIKIFALLTILLTCQTAFAAEWYEGMEASTVENVNRQILTYDAQETDITKVRVNPSLATSHLMSYDIASDSVGFFAVAASPPMDHLDFVGHEVNDRGSYGNYGGYGSYGDYR
jgi:hypothetical protein